MAKSRIIKQLANGEIDLKTALKRAKVILSDLDDDKISQWVTNEIIGYPDSDHLPAYRIIQGSLKGNYFLGAPTPKVQCSNSPLSTRDMPEEVRDALLNVYLTEGVEALKMLSERHGDIGKSVPQEYCGLIQKYNKNPFITVVTADVIIDSHMVVNALSVIENKLLDILMVLEKEFGSLDDLDIDISNKSEIELQDVAKQITYIITDNSVTIGDGNKIKDLQIKMDDDKLK